MPFILVFTSEPSISWTTFDLTWQQRCYIFVAMSQEPLALDVLETMKPDLVLLEFPGSITHHAYTHLQHLPGLTHVPVLQLAKDESIHHLRHMTTPSHTRVYCPPLLAVIDSLCNGQEESDSFCRRAIPVGPRGNRPENNEEG